MARALGMDPADLLDLSQNLNPFAPDVAAICRRRLDALGRYPDDREATGLLAQALGVDRERLLLTNGGSEAIRLVAAEWGGGVRSEPEFALHPRDSDPDHPAGPRWRSDPHSPSGKLASMDEHADVWDEAFYALATGRWTAGRPGIVVGSLTKTFACPGLRLGYVIAADAGQRERLATHQSHWSMSALSLACLPDLLEQADLVAWSARIGQLREELTAILSEHGISAQPADAPWVLAPAPGLRERLAPLGVLVRDCASFGLPGMVRVAVPDEDGLARMRGALARSAGAGVDSAAAPEDEVR